MMAKHEDPGVSSGTALTEDGDGVVGWCDDGADFCGDWIRRCFGTVASDVDGDWDGKSERTLG